MLTSDRGGEYLSKEFEDTCKNQGVPYSPQQNGIIKRKHRTLVKMITSIPNS